MAVRQTIARLAWKAHPARPGAEYGLLDQSQWW